MIRIDVPNADASAIQARIARQTRAEFDASCEPSGYEIIVTVHPGLGAEAVLRLSSGEVALGAVDLTF